MSNEAVLVFTGRSIEQMVSEGGSSAWALDPRRARRAGYVVCARNSRATFTTPGPEEHGSAFLIARIRDVVPSRLPRESGRFLIVFGEYARIDVPNAWEHWRNPVRYTTLSDIGPEGIDPERLEWIAMPDNGASSDSPPAGATAAAQQSLSIADAKRALAETFGVSPDAIEITIRG